MPLVAQDKETGRRIDITQYNNPRDEIQSDSLICPYCGGEMIVVAGLIVIHHFRHKVECSSDVDHHPESLEHLRTKMTVAKKAGEWFGELTNASPELEVYIPEANRIADVLFTFPNGWRVACEVQLASITIEQLQKRTNDYLKAGVDVFWFLGKSADTPANRDWSISNFGFSLRLHYGSHLIEDNVALVEIKA